MNQWINQMNQSMKDQDVFRALRTQCIIIKYELRFIIGFLKFTLRKIKLRNLSFQIDGLQCMKQVVEDSNAFFPAFFLKRMNCWVSMLFFINVMSLLRLYLKVAFLKKVWCIFLIAQKMCRKLFWKRDFEIAFCLELADSNCTAVSKGGKIQNTKL